MHFLRSLLENQRGDLSGLRDYQDLWDDPKQPFAARPSASTIQVREVQESGVGSPKKLSPCLYLFIVARRCWEPLDARLEAAANGGKSFSLHMTPAAAVWHGRWSAASLSESAFSRQETMLAREREAHLAQSECLFSQRAAVSVVRCYVDSLSRSVLLRESASAICDCGLFLWEISDRVLCR